MNHLLESILLNQLREGQCIVTPNQHLAYVLKQTYLKQRPYQAHHDLFCLPYPTFLKQCFELASDPHGFQQPEFLLNPMQTKSLWRKLCLEHTPSLSDNLVDDSLRAWQLCQTWQIDLTAPAFRLTTASSFFQSVALDFHTSLKKLKAITEAQIPAYLSKESYSLSLPYESVVFACFDDFHPAQNHLIQFLKEQDIQVSYYDLPSRECETRYVMSKDDIEERQAILSWLQHQSEDQTAALIVPQLENSMPLLKRYFHAHFPEKKIYFSLGQPLYNYPLIESLFQTLSLNTQEPFNREQIKYFLQSTLIPSTHEETAHRQRLLIECASIPHITPGDFIMKLAAYCPLLVAFIQRLYPYPEKDSPTHWSHHFLKRLDVHFPLTTLTQESLEVCQRLFKLIDEFQTLSLIHKTVSQEQALSTLKRLAKETIFQPKQTNDANLYVLGPFEAAGVYYDHIWLMGLTEHQFPPPFVPNVFIPIELQETYQLPHINKVHDRQLATKRLLRIQKATQHLVISYPAHTQNTANRPHFFLLNANNQPMFPEYITLPYQEKKQILEQTTSSFFLPVNIADDHTYSSGLLSEYAKCPFRAFAIYRLHLKDYNVTSTFFNPKDRGILLHQALENLWRHLGSQASLLRLSEEQILKFIQLSITEAFKQPVLKNNIPEGLRHIEKLRLEKLLIASLSFEKKRTPFSIAHLEKTYQLKIGPLQFKIRLDRIDLVHPNQKWIIDYKTSPPTPLPWECDEPLDPQILLYGLIDEPVSGLLFYELKKGEAKIHGICESPHPGLSELKENETWALKQHEWQSYLEKIAEGFYSGNYLPKPAYPGLCHRCEFIGLCGKEDTKEKKFKPAQNQTPRLIE